MGKGGRSKGRKGINGDNTEAGDLPSKSTKSWTPTAGPVITDAKLLRF